MNNSPLKAQPFRPSSNSKQKQSSIVKLLVFQMEQLNLAFTIDSVQKVISYTPVYSSGLTDTGIAHIDDHEVTVLDLYHRLYHRAFVPQEEANAYLIVVKNSAEENFAIIITDTPVLMDIPLSNLRILPESYRQRDTLEIASHVMVIPQEPEPLTVFLLDVDCLVPPNS